MTGMFKDAMSFSCDIRNWNVKNLQEIEHMWKGASSFKFDFSIFDEKFKK